MSVDAWDQRQLCPDGGCVGVIGPDGTCKVCGRAAPNWGDPRRVGLIEPADADEAAETNADVIDPLAPEAPAVLGELAEWRERRLCSDGGCIGVIGADGRCKVCGKPAGAASAATAAVDETEDDVNDDEDDDEDDVEDDDRDEAEDAELEAAARDLAASLTSREVDDEPRKLCPDGACVGVIGADGKCKLCGKEAA
ncbi:MAG TPA: hypothetical protein VFQ53_40155 [Kofleriaceae bacterium]|nr:hypothetical protein [Kofleriaceae bacterium]